MANPTDWDKETFIATEWENQTITPATSWVVDDGSPSAGIILLENSDNILLENGFNLILE